MTGFKRIVIIPFLSAIGFFVFKAVFKIAFVFMLQLYIRLKRKRKRFR